MAGVKLGMPKLRTGPVCNVCFAYIYIYINFCLAQDLQWPDPDYHADADGGNGTWQAEDLRSSVSHDPLTFIYIYMSTPVN